MPKRDTTLYTTAQVAAELRITPRRVLALAVSRGVGRRFGPVWQFSRADIEAMRERTEGWPKGKSRSKLPPKPLGIPY